MYIQKAKIENIRSIIDFEIEFPYPAGWHVLIGDNGAGKSTIIRSMALALVGRNQIAGLRADWNDWINRHFNEAEIKVNLITDGELDKFFSTSTESLTEQVRSHLVFVDGEFEKQLGLTTINDEETYIDIEQNKAGCFSVAYGPFRRFDGGNPEWKRVFKTKSLDRLSAHLSVFGEDVALTEAISWLIDLHHQSLEKVKESQYTLENLSKLINSEDFLPHNANLNNVSSAGVFFDDGNETTISVQQMSDGYRSILSMTFEMIRQLVRVYGAELVFKHIEKGEMFIDLPGVVLVDEIDAHLHPTWQTRIGNWFLKYFPKLQFIVTTHSPLVCRAAEKGSIWRLAAPGSDEESCEVTGVDRERLIYGNILDAYGTEVFGDNVSISEESNKILKRIAELNIKSMIGEIGKKETDELVNLRAKMPTENKIIEEEPTPKAMKTKAGSVLKSTHTDVFEHLADETGLTKAQSKEFFNALSDLAKKEVKKNGEFTVPGFGKLVKAKRKARTGRNPATGNPIKIPAKTTVKFRVGKAIKDSVA